MPSTVHGIGSALPGKAKSVRVAAGKNPFQLVACDMDGTLLTGLHSISDFTRNVLSQLLARGVHIIFATGRPFTDVNRIKRRLNIFAAANAIPTPGVQVVTPVVASPAGLCSDNSLSMLSGSPARQHRGSDGGSQGGGAAAATATGDASPPSAAGNGSPMAEKVVPRCFAVTSNGACIYNEMNERIYEASIAPQLCKELYRMFAEDPDININVFRGVDEEERRRAGYINPSDQGEDKASEEWVSRYPSDLEAALYKESKFTFRVVPDIETNFPVDHVNEIFFLCYDLEKSRRAEKAIAERMEQLRREFGLAESVRVAPSAPYCLDVIPSAVSKASALEHVLQALSLTMGDCVAFGDGLNDVEMLSSAGKGFIMGNANPRLKDHLPHLEVIGTNDEEAVAHKLQELFGLDA